MLHCSRLCNTQVCTRTYTHIQGGVTHTCTITTRTRTNNCVHTQTGLDCIWPEHPAFSVAPLLSRTQQHSKVGLDFVILFFSVWCVFEWGPFAFRVCGMHACVASCECMRARVCACECVSVSVFVYACTCAYMCVCVQWWAPIVKAYVQSSGCTYKHAHTRTNAHAHTNAHMQARTHTYTHTYMHATHSKCILPPSCPHRLRSPFHRTISSRTSERDQSHSILSVLDHQSKHPRTPRYAGQEGECERAPMCVCMC